MTTWNRRAFAVVALVFGAAWLSSIINNPQETNDYGFVSSSQAQPAPIHKLIEWLRGMTMPAGIVKAEGRIEATQIDVSSKYAGELVEVMVQAGDRVASGRVIARLKSPELEAQLQIAQSKLQSVREAGAQDAIPAAEAKVRQINSMISDLRVVSPREGKVQYQLAHAGDTIEAGAPIVTLIDLTDAYMTVFVRAADAAKLGLSDQARLILDAAPDYVIPATVGFVASGPSSSSKTAETKDQLAREMLRVDLKVDPKILQTYYAKVETGLRGVGFVRTRADAKWPVNLQVKLPPAPIAQESPPTPAHVAQEPASPPSPIGGPAVASAAPAAPVAEATAPEPGAQQVTPTLPPVSVSEPVSAPPAALTTSAPVVREVAPTPPPPQIPAPPSASVTAHAPAAQASMSARLAHEVPTGEVAPESLAQLTGAWAPSTDDCKRLFQRRGGALAFRQPVDQFAQAAIIESQRIRLPTGVCRLERASSEGGALRVSGECHDSISYTSETAYVKLRSANELVFNTNGDRALNTSMMRCPG